MPGGGGGRGPRGQSLPGRCRGLDCELLPCSPGHGGFWAEVPEGRPRPPLCLPGSGAGCPFRLEPRVGAVPWAVSDPGLGGTAHGHGVQDGHATQPSPPWPAPALLLSAAGLCCPRHLMQMGACALVLLVTGVCHLVSGWPCGLSSPGGGSFPSRWGDGGTGPSSPPSEPRVLTASASLMLAMQAQPAAGRCPCCHSPCRYPPHCPGAGFSPGPAPRGRGHRLEGGWWSWVWWEPCFPGAWGGRAPGLCAEAREAGRPGGALGPGLKIK